MSLTTWAQCPQTSSGSFCSWPVSPRDQLEGLNKITGIDSKYDINKCCLQKQSEWDLLVAMFDPSLWLNDGRGIAKLSWLKSGSHLSGLKVAQSDGTDPAQKTKMNCDLDFGQLSFIRFVLHWHVATIRRLLAQIRQTGVDRLSAIIPRSMWAGWRCLVQFLEPRVTSLETFLSSFCGVAGHIVNWHCWGVQMPWGGELV